MRRTTNREQKRDGERQRTGEWLKNECSNKHKIKNVGTAAYSSYVFGVYLLVRIDKSLWPVQPARQFNQ